MIKKNQQFLNFFNGATDFITVILSYSFAVWFWLDLLNNTGNNIAASHSIQRGAALSACAYALAMVMLFAILGLYNPSRIRPVRREFLIVVEANALGILAVGALLFLFRQEEFSRGVLGVFFIMDSLLLCIKRLLFHGWLSYMRRNGYNLKHVYVIGTGSLACNYAQNIKKQPYFGFAIDGYFGDGNPPDERKLLGSFADFMALPQLPVSVDEVVIALAPDETQWIEPVISICEKSGTKVSVIPFYNDIIPSKPTIEIIGNTKLINLRSNPLDNFGYAALKRLGDIVLSVLALILLSPLFLIAAIGIKLTMAGPILFKQTRVGKNKRNFQILKFRSMRINDSQETGWTTTDDDRRTRFGSFLRKFSIDELPQLINVIKGDMSLVGPRPETPYYVENFKESIALYMVKHQVRPGITGWAQVNGYRGDTSISKRIEHDIWYIENWSLGLDLIILLRTALGGWINKEHLVNGNDAES